MTIAYLRSPSFSGSPMLDASPPVSPRALPLPSGSIISAIRRWSIQSIDTQEMIVPNDSMEAGLSLRRLPASPSAGHTSDDDGPAATLMSRSVSDHETVGLGISRRSATAATAFPAARTSAPALPSRRSQLVFEQKLQERRGITELGASGSWNGSSTSGSVAGGLTPRTRRKRPGTAPVHYDDPSSSPKTPESAPAFFDLSARKEGISPGGGLRELTISSAAAPASKRASWIRRGGDGGGGGGSGEALSDSSHTYLSSLSRSSGGMSTSTSSSSSSRRHSSFLGEYRNGQTIPVFTSTSLDASSFGSTPVKRMSEGDIHERPRRSSSTRSSLPSPEEEAELDVEVLQSTDDAVSKAAGAAAETSAPNEDVAQRAVSGKADSPLEFAARGASTGVLAEAAGAAPKSSDAFIEEAAARAEHAATSSSAPTAETSNHEAASDAPVAVREGDDDTYRGPPSRPSSPPSSVIAKSSEAGEQPMSAAFSSAHVPAPTAVELLAPAPRQSQDRRGSSTSDRPPSRSQDWASLDPALRRESASSTASADSGSTYRIRRKPVPSPHGDNASLYSFVSASASVKSPIGTSFDLSGSRLVTVEAAPPTSPGFTQAALGEERQAAIVGASSSEDPDQTPTIPQVQHIAHNRTPSDSDFMRKAQEAAQARMDQMKAEKLWEASKDTRTSSSTSSSRPMRPSRRIRPSTAQAAPQSELKAISFAPLSQRSLINGDVAAESVEPSPAEEGQTDLDAKDASLKPDNTQAPVMKGRARSRVNLKRPSTAPSRATGPFRQGWSRDDVPAFLEVEGQQFVFDDPTTTKAELEEKLPPSVPNLVALNREAKAISHDLKSGAGQRPKTPLGLKGFSGIAAQKAADPAQSVGWELEEEVHVTERAKGHGGPKPKESVDSEPAPATRPDSVRGGGGHARPSDAKLQASASLRIKEAARASTIDAPPAGSYSIHPPSMLQLFEASQCTLYDEEGEQVVFGDLFKARRTLVCFLRHWWCGFCQQFAMSLKKIDPLPLKAANMDLIIVGQGDWQIMKSYKQVMEVPFKMYADPMRNIYRALRMTMRTNEASPVCARPDYAQLGMTKAILVAIKKGLFDMPICSPGDMKLLGGDFILGPGLQCSFTHRMTTADGHLDVPRILAQAGCDLSLKSPKPPPSTAEATARLATLAGGNRNGTGRSFGRSKQKKKEAKEKAQQLAGTPSSLSSAPSAAGSLSALQGVNKFTRLSLWSRLPGSRLKSSRSQASLPSSNSVADLSHTFNSVRDRNQGRSLSIMRKISYESRHHQSYSSARPPSMESSNRSFYSGVDRSELSTPVPPAEAATVTAAATSSNRAYLSPTDSTDAFETPRVGSSSRSSPPGSDTFASGEYRGVSKSSSISSFSSDRPPAVPAAAISKALSDRALSQSSLQSRTGPRSPTPLSNFQSRIMLRQRQSGGNLAGSVRAQTQAQAPSQVKTQAPPSSSDTGEPSRRAETEATANRQGQTAQPDGPNSAHRSPPNGRAMPEAPESVQSHRSGSDLDSAEADPSHPHWKQSGDVKRRDLAHTDARESMSSAVSRTFSSDAQRAGGDAPVVDSFLMELDVYDSLSRQPSRRFYNDRSNGSDTDASFGAGQFTLAQTEAADSDSDTEPTLGGGNENSHDIGDADHTPTMVWTPRMRGPDSGGAKASITKSLSTSTIESTPTSPTTSPSSSRGSNYASPSMGSLYGFGGYRPNYGLTAHLEEEEEEDEGGQAAPRAVRRW